MKPDWNGQITEHSEWYLVVYFPPMYSIRNLGKLHQHRRKETHTENLKTHSEAPFYKFKFDLLWKVLKCFSSLLPKDTRLLPTTLFWNKRQEFSVLPGFFFFFFCYFYSRDTKFAPPICIYTYIIKCITSAVQFLHIAQGLYKFGKSVLLLLLTVQLHAKVHKHRTDCFCVNSPVSFAGDLLTLIP